MVSCEGGPRFVLVPALYVKTDHMMGKMPKSRAVIQATRNLELSALAEANGASTASHA